jgi:uncharacterized protein YndB with AHSA1/START domain
MEISESVEILAPPGRVFSLLMDVEKRTHLNPVWESVEVYRLNTEEGEGARYRIKGRHGGRVVEYVTEWREVERDRRLVYESIEGPRFRVEQTLRMTPVGTRLTHVERFQEERELADQEIQSARKLLRSWLLSMKSYLELERSFATRLWRRFFDRFLLRASPRERQAAQFVLLIEGALLLVALITLTAFKVVSLLSK